MRKASGVKILNFTEVVNCITFIKFVDKLRCEVATVSGQLLWKQC
jgi:hypothetical protein